MQDAGNELVGLDRMSTGNLAERYKELDGQPCRMVLYRVLITME